MWKAFFWALGLYVCLLGAQCLVLDRAVLSRKEVVPSSMPFMSATERNKEFRPPDWAPWSLFALGVVTLLYSFTIPKRMGA